MDNIIHLDLTDKVILNAEGIDVSSFSIPENCNAKIQVNPENSHLECFISASDIFNERKRKEHQQNVVAALSRDFRNVYLVNLKRGDLSIIKLDGYLTKGFNLEPKKRFPYAESCARYVKDRVHPDDQAMMLRVMSAPAVMEGLKKNDEYVGTYRVLERGATHYYQYKYVKVKGSSEVVVGFQNVDSLIMDERKHQEELNNLVEQDIARRKILSSLAQIYFCVYYIDMATGGFQALGESSVEVIRKYIGKVGDAREKFRIVYEQLVDPEQSQEVADFTNLDTLSARLSNRDYIALRFYGIYVGWCEGLFVPVERDEKGNCTKVIWVLRSIKEEVAKEEAYKSRLRVALQKAEQASDAKTHFLARMSHDIRTPLNGIIGILDLMEMTAMDAKASVVYRGKARIAANHLLSLLNDVLEMSKLEDAETELVEEPFNLQQVFSEVYTIATLRAGENSVTIKSDKSVNLKYLNLLGSPLYIRQVFLNILTNAVKYNKMGGTVFCYSEIVSENADSVTYCFHVDDTGVGMKPEFLEHLFEPFAQEREDARSKFQGSGMGMAIVKRLVDKMHGQITVESSVGKGSRFAVTLPFRINHSTVTVPEKIPADISLEGMNILLVEDNDLNMEIGKSLLENLGVVVTCARNGLEAVEIFEKKPEGSLDAILMDLMMPVLDGYGATKRIRLSDKKDGTLIPIIALSANAFVEDMQKSKRAGMNGHLSKPIDMTQLKKVLARFVK